MNAPAARYTIRFNAGTERPWAYGSGFKELGPAMLAAWDVLLSNGDAVEAIIYRGNLYIGKMKPDGRLYDAELRQLGVCITRDSVELTL